MGQTFQAEHTANEHKGIFNIRREGKRLAEMTYSVAGNDKIIIDHTQVSDELRGQGAGLVLVEAAVNWARSMGYSIIPLCPFAKATLQKHPEWQDVVAK
jgi:predicted GNAT family acetyltransferase